MSGEDQLLDGAREKGVGKGNRGKSRDIMASFEARLARVELAVADDRDRIGELAESMAESTSGGEGLRGDMQGELNRVVELLRGEMEAIREAFQAEMISIREEFREEIKAMKGDIALCKLAASQGVVNAQFAPRVDVPRPKNYDGSRNARELDNFLWGLEQYFEASGVLEDAAKIKTAPLYLSEAATLWWRRRHADIEKGLCHIDTWDEFKKEIKRQFYPENATREARAKLRRLTHKGCIRDHVKEFTELVLEIPSMTDQDALFTYVDGLEHWAKLKVQRRGPQDLASAIAIAESLIEFGSPSSWGHGGHDEDDDSSEDESSEGSEAEEESKPFVRNKGKAKQDLGGQDKPKLECFLCAGPHKAMDCPQRNKLMAMLKEDEEEEPSTSQRVECTAGSMRILGSMRGHIEGPQPKGSEVVGCPKAPKHKGSVGGQVEKKASTVPKTQEAKRKTRRAKGKRVVNKPREGQEVRVAAKMDRACTGHGDRVAAKGDDACTDRVAQKAKGKTKRTKMWVVKAPKGEHEDRVAAKDGRVKEVSKTDSRKKTRRGRRGNRWGRMSRTDISRPDGHEVRAFRELPECSRAE